MTLSEFYTSTYHGSSIPAEIFESIAREASAQLARYKRIYTVTGDETAEQMALCAMADAMYYFAQAANGQIATSTAVGSVSCSSQQTAGVDISPEAQQREYLRCAEKHLEIYRGC